MISNEIRSPYTGQPYEQNNYSPHSQPPRQPVPEDTLKTGQIQIERKTFSLTLKENLRGRFLRISEDSNTRRNSIIIPSTGLTEFKRLVEEMERASSEIQAKGKNGSAQPAVQ